MTIERFGPPSPGPGGRAVPFTKAVRAGDFVFVSGQVPMGSDGEIVHGSIVEQTHQTVANIKSILADLDLGLEHVVKATVWLADTRDFWPFNKVYNEYFRSGPAGAFLRSRRHDGGLQGRDRGHRLRSEIDALFQPAG